VVALAREPRPRRARTVLNVRREFVATVMDAETKRESSEGACDDAIEVESVRLLRRIVRILLAVVGCVLLLVVVLIGAFYWHMTPPSDASLERRFYKHRADLEQIVKMMDEDVRMTRIAYDFTTTDDDKLNDSRVFSEQRWNQYREVFRRAEVAYGTARDPKSGDVEITAWVRELAPFGVISTMVHTLSYVHCGAPTASRVSDYAPCLERKESGKKEEDPTNHIGLIRYKRIEGDWYLYEFKNYSQGRPFPKGK
jgi:hypothetical protein